ncbi:hypothetical protein HNO52_17025 [Billgrantia diversa]|uniref:hypothetical protein n=1 Tax=Halomonas sp. MCCC 1A13316 TaxID=2733487 RepID=UPI0018A5600A|nr:hypothetical protein [Halomonas sp. MCCC 1A13316]QOR40030.1 hypothetical protein HNO52_17025 [Halomonas sp. MCCC 1A13316]
MVGTASLDMDPWTVGHAIALTGFYASALLAVGGVLFRNIRLPHADCIPVGSG